MRESNTQPIDYKSIALPVELMQHVGASDMPAPCMCAYVPHARGQENIENSHPKPLPAYTLTMYG